MRFTTNHKDWTLRVRSRGAPVWCSYLQQGRLYTTVHYCGTVSTRRLDDTFEVLLLAGIQATVMPLAGGYFSCAEARWQTETLCASVETSLGIPPGPRWLAFCCCPWAVLLSLGSPGVQNSTPKATQEVGGTSVVRKREGMKRRFGCPSSGYAPGSKLV